jgi:hypothetical protein
MASHCLLLWLVESMPVWSRAGVWLPDRAKSAGHGLKTWRKTSATVLSIIELGISNGKVPVAWRHVVSRGASGRERFAGRSPAGYLLIVTPA